MKYTRLGRMEAYVASREFVSLDELCEMFGKSKNTIRRDVSELVASGVAEKVYGGVKAIKRPPNALISFSDRSIAHSDAKKEIGRLAAQHINEGDIIFIDSGTTVMNILPHLSAFNGLTILSNNLYVITYCMNYPGINAISFGGQLCLETASFSANYCSLENLRQFNISKAFMSATGVSLNKGATNTTSAEATIKREVVNISATNILLADTSKFGNSALLTYAELSAFQYVITDEPPSAEYAQYFREKSVVCEC